MKTYKLYQVDAFTETRFGGNPCAVVMEADSLTSEEMQKIATEMNLSETAFVVKSDKADFGARYFTPQEEIPMAGHPTISTIFTLIQNGDIVLNENFLKLTLELKAGIFPIEIKRENGKILITMTQLASKFLMKYEPEDICKTFSLKPQDLLDDYPIQSVSTGTPQLMIPLSNKGALKRIEINMSEFSRLKNNGDFFSVHLFALEGFTGEGDVYSRHFCAPPKVFEDPFTGSATGGMGAYLWHYRLMKKNKFIAEQGHFMGRPGIAEVELIGTPGNIEGIKVSGTAVPVFEATLQV